MQRSVTIDYGDDLLAGLGLSPEEFSREAKFLLAAKLYELGKVTQEQAAGLCGMGRGEFLMALLRAGMKASNLRASDAETELGFARRA